MRPDESPAPVPRPVASVNQQLVVQFRQCRVVELRFFAGLNIDQAAEALGISPATVEREWALAKA